MHGGWDVHEEWNKPKADGQWINWNKLDALTIIITRLYTILFIVSIIVSIIAIFKVNKAVKVVDETKSE